MRVVHLAAYKSGGAGRAMNRIIEAVESVGRELPVQQFLIVPQDRPGFRLTAEYFLRQVHRIPSRILYKSSEPGIHSVARVRTSLAHKLLAMRADLVHLHWLGDSTLSIEQIGSLAMPIVWTMHDMWPFCGAEHITALDRFKEGYSKSNRPVNERGPDVNLLTWERKIANWSRPMHAVAPSRWMLDQLESSALSKAFVPHLVRNPADQDFWKRTNRLEFRRGIGLAEKDIFLIFAASEGLQDSNKGGPEIPEIVSEIRGRIPAGRGVTLGVLGRPVKNFGLDGVVVRQFGYVDDDVLLRNIFSAADFLLSPSKIDNAPSLVTEALLCSLPVAAYPGNGISELVINGKTGVIAGCPESPKALAIQIVDVILSGKVFSLSKNARQSAMSLTNPQEIGRAYARLYSDVCERT